MYSSMVTAFLFLSRLSFKAAKTADKQIIYKQNQEEFRKIQPVSDLRAALLDLDVFVAVPPLFHCPWNSDAEMLY